MHHVAPWILIVKQAFSHFTATFDGLQPNASYAYNVKAYRGGLVYGQQKTIVLTTPMATPAITINNYVYSTTTEVSWTIPSPYGSGQYIDEFTVYHQQLGRAKRIVTTTDGVHTGDWWCQNGFTSTNEIGDCVGEGGGQCLANAAQGTTVTCRMYEAPVELGFFRFPGPYWTSTLSGVAAPTQCWAPTPTQYCILEPHGDRSRRNTFTR